VVNFFTLAGDATSDYDANGNLIRSTAIPIQFARHTNVIGPADSGPGLVCRPFARTPGSLEGPTEVFGDYADFFIGGAQAPDAYIEPGEEHPGEACP
jgi:hypothetical protein